MASAKPGGAHSLARIDTALTLERGGWIAARAVGATMLPYGATWWQQPVMAHTTPVYLEADGRPAPAAESAALFLEQLAFLRKWAETEARFPAPSAKAEALGYISKAEAVYRGLQNRR